MPLSSPVVDLFTVFSPTLKEQQPAGPLVPVSGTRSLAAVPKTNTASQYLFDDAGDERQADADESLPSADSSRPRLAYQLRRLIFTTYALDLNATFYAPHLPSFVEAALWEDKFCGTLSLVPMPQQPLDIYGSSTSWHHIPPWLHRQERLRSRQPPSPDLTSGLLDYLDTRPALYIGGSEKAPLYAIRTISEASLNRRATHRVSERLWLTASAAVEALQHEIHSNDSSIYDLTVTLMRQHNWDDGNAGAYWPKSLFGLYELSADSPRVDPSWSPKPHTSNRLFRITDASPSHDAIILPGSPLSTGLQGAQASPDAVAAPTFLALPLLLAVLLCVGCLVLPVAGLLWARNRALKDLSQSVETQHNSPTLPASFDSPDASGWAGHTADSLAHPGVVRFNINHVLGRGSNGTIVFEYVCYAYLLNTLTQKATIASIMFSPAMHLTFSSSSGFYGSQPAAIKRILRQPVFEKSWLREHNILLQHHHEHLIRCYWTPEFDIPLQNLLMNCTSSLQGSSPNFHYLVLQRCEKSLLDVFSGTAVPSLHPLLSFNLGVIQSLYQLATAISFLHSSGVGPVIKKLVPICCPLFLVVHSDSLPNSFWLEVHIYSIERRPMQHNYFLSVDAKSEVFTGDNEEVHAPLHFLFSHCIECAVISEKFVDGGCGDMRAEVHLSLVDESAVSIWTAKLLHDFSQPVAIHRVKGFRLIHKGSVKVSPHLLALLLQLASGENHFDCSSVSAEATLAFREQSLLQPGNVFLLHSAAASGGQFRLVLGDFGLSLPVQNGHFQNSFTLIALAGAAGGTKSMSTDCGLIQFGSLGWMAPEMAANSADLTPAVDVFAYGLVAFFILSAGRHPFDLEKPADMEAVDEEVLIDRSKKEAHSVALAASSSFHTLQSIQMAINDCHQPALRSLSEHSKDLGGGKIPDRMARKFPPFPAPSSSLLSLPHAFLL
ncbi:unnamed protein product [Schistocephalus solidus]|uniref:Protein kinase domain-containing protein n=1 Tax=Schistocephalus solidus TaxID=70667 RepID=A0A3P7E4P5_SCHSO|nr:unnamed protein product [Schistocephalus solidus]